MLEVLTSYEQVLALSSKDLLCWLCDKAWRDNEWHENGGPNAVLYFEPAQRKEETSFLFIDKSGAYYRAGSIEALIRECMWREMKASDKPILKEFVPRHRHSRNGLGLKTR